MKCPNCGATVELVAPPAPSLVMTAPPPAPPPIVTPGLRVNGNRIVDKQTGLPVVLRGVNRGGTVDACLTWAMASGPYDQASIEAMKAWKVNSVRIALNEDCWLGINGVPALWSGSNYQTFIHDYVDRLLASGIYPVLTLMYNAPGATVSKGTQLMADADHALAFWTSVATLFKGEDRIIFEPYNEPHDITWAVWRNGGGGWIGMQQMVDAIRKTGATNIISCVGNHWGDDLTGWLANRPSDPNVVAGLHVYNFVAVNTVPEWDAQVAPVAAQVPVLASEVGCNNCDANFMNSLLSWLDAHGIGYLAWVWDTWGLTCADIALVSDYAGTPTTYGAIYKNFLAALP